jgi:hypothetical protein
MRGHDHRRKMSEIEKPLDKLADEINAEHRAFVGTFRKTVEHGIRAGELLTEAKAQCPHGTWLEWLGGHFEGAPRTAQEYMQLYNRRDEIRAKTRDSAHLSVSGALKELAAPTRPDGIPPEEWVIVKHAAEDVSWVGPDLERLAAMPGERRRGFVAEIAWWAMMEQGRAYREAMDEVEERIEDGGMRSVTPDTLARSHAEADKLRWWVAQVEWIETLVRACDWPPGGGMPRAAFDENRTNLPLSRLYSSHEDGRPDWMPDYALLSPRAAIREFCGPVV